MHSVGGYRRETYILYIIGGALLYGIGKLVEGSQEESRRRELVAGEQRSGCCCYEYRDWQKRMNKNHEKYHFISRYFV